MTTNELQILINNQTAWAGVMSLLVEQRDTLLASIAVENANLVQEYQRHLAEKDDRIIELSGELSAAKNQAAADAELQQTIAKEKLEKAVLEITTQAENHMLERSLQSAEVNKRLTEALTVADAKIVDMDAQIEALKAEGAITGKRVAECLGMAAQLRAGLDLIEVHPEKLPDLKYAMDRILNYAQTPELERQLQELEAIQKDASDKAAELRLRMSA